MAAQLVESKRIHTPTIWEYDDLAALAALDVALMLDVLESGRGVADATVPPTAVEFARRVAERGIPISELLRTYRVAHAGALQTALEEVARLTRDAELRTAAGVELVQLTFDYVDRASEQVVAVYQEARDRRLQRRLLVINEASRRIGALSMPSERLANWQKWAPTSLPTWSLSTCLTPRCRNRSMPTRSPKRLCCIELPGSPRPEGGRIRLPWGRSIDCLMDRSRRARWRRAGPCVTP